MIKSTGKWSSKTFMGTSRLKWLCQRFIELPPGLKKKNFLPQNLHRSSEKKSQNTHKKLALFGAAVSLSAFALPSPWSWVVFILGLQLFAPLVGLGLKRSRESDKAQMIEHIQKRMDTLEREIAMGDKNETGLTTHNKRIEYNTLAKLLEAIFNEQ